MTRCVRVPKREGQRAKDDLGQMGIFDSSYRIMRDGDFLFLPIKGDAVPEGYQVTDRDLMMTESAETDFRRIADVPEDLRPLLPSSFDVIGDLAIVKVPEELRPYEESIGDSMMKSNPRLRVVLSDEGVKGERRIRDLRRIAGEGGTRSVHTEFGVRICMDPCLVYFNPRLSNERHRIAVSVRNDEVIIDMFSGVGPFPLVIRRHAFPKAVYAIDINEDAIALMEENIRMNHADRIIPLLGDAREVLKGLPEADRVIMNLPQSSLDFLPCALEKVAIGGTINMYIISERDAWPDTLRNILQHSRESGRPVEVSYEHELKTYSPTMSVYALDLRRV